MTIRYVFDVEADGFLEDLTTIHSLVLKNPDTGEVFSYCDRQPRTGRVREGVERLMQADQIIGHNIIKYDLKALNKVFPWFEIDEEKAFDTLLVAQMVFPDIYLEDVKRPWVPRTVRGKYSLDAFGYRLKNYKGDFEGPWDTWTSEMQDYCEQDVEVTEKLLKWIEEKLEGHDWSAALELEHAFAFIIARIEEQGFAFDERAAVELYADLASRRDELQKELTTLFKPWWVPVEVFTPRRDNKRLGYVEGVPFTKVEFKTFNPGSRQQISDRLRKVRGWHPTEFTETGLPKIDEEILNGLPYEEAKKIAEFFTLQKTIGMLAEGENAWLKLVRNGRIHGSINPNGANTGRCTHFKPNIGQVPSVDKPFGKQCRSLFKASKGMVQVGVDASGLELRGLAGYLSSWDKGRYIREVLEGDVHTVNQTAAGLVTRNQAKTFIYAFLYGAGPEKIGSIVGKGKNAGIQLTRRFLERIPAIKKLKEAVAKALKEKGFLKGLDGRKLAARSAHSALNLLLQSAGAIIMKKATVLAYQDLSMRGWVWGRDYAFVAHVHDEIQAECRPEIAEELGEIMVEAIRKAGKALGFSCPLDGEAKIGRNWSETH